MHSLIILVVQMTKKTFADFRIDQIMALYSLQLREERNQRDKQIRVDKKLKNKVTTMPEIDLQGFVSEAEGSKKKDTLKRMSNAYAKRKREKKIAKLIANKSHWEFLS